MRVVVATIVGFIGMFVTNAIMAAAVIGPFFEERYGEIVASSPQLPALIGGYLVIAFVMALLYPRLQIGSSWLSRGLLGGALVGLAAFLGTHMVITGYTTIDAAGFVVSGLLDSLGPIVGMLAIGYVYYRSGHPEDVIQAA